MNLTYRVTSLGLLQSSYIIWPAAARELLSHLPIDSPTDCYIAKLVLEGKVTAIVASPALAEQRDPYAKGDIKHTNIYNWQEAKVEKAKAAEKKLLNKAATSVESS